MKTRTPQQESHKHSGAVAAAEAQALARFRMTAEQRHRLSLRASLAHAQERLNCNGFGVRNAKDMGVGREVALAIWALGTAIEKLDELIDGKP